MEKAMRKSLGKCESWVWWGLRESPVLDKQCVSQVDGVTGMALACQLCQGRTY